MGENELTLWASFIEWWTLYGQYIDYVGMVVTFGLVLYNSTKEYEKDKKKHNEKLEKGEVTEKFDESGNYGIGMLIMLALGTFFWPFYWSAYIWEYFLKKNEKEEVDK